MYETINNGPKAESCREPDWETEISKARTEIKIIYDFKDSFLKFIETIGYRRSRGDRDYLAELLGTVVIDLMQREKNIEYLLNKLEGKEK